MIIPTAEPFFFPGGPTGVLLVHGFTGSPKELRWIGETLAKQGYAVLGIRLAAHATHPDEMTRVTWQDWLTSVEDGYHLLKGIANEVIVAGLSMGGVLSLLFSSKFTISGLITMSTPYNLPPDPRLRYLNLLSRLIPTIPKDEPDWRDPTLANDHVDYPFYTTKAILELNKLVQAMQAALPDVKAPVLLIHSQQDRSVPHDHMEKIYNRLGSLDKMMFTIENSGHVITRDIEKDRVFEAVNKFIQRICGVD